MKEEFIQQIIHYLRLNTPRIEKCLNQLSETTVWQAPNESTNSIANLILHLCGNIRQYIISSLGHQKDIRARDKEFSTKGGFTKAELYSKLAATVAEAVVVLENISASELLRVRVVQGFELSGIGIAIHVTEHYSYHVGQIAYWTKILNNQDLGFYADLDLNILNQ